MRILFLTLICLPLFTVAARPSINIQFSKDSLQVKFSFVKPTIEKENNGYVSIKMEGASYQMKGGRSRLPFYTQKIVLPPQKALNSPRHQSSRNIEPIKLSAPVKNAAFAVPYSLRQSFKNGISTTPAPINGDDLLQKSFYSYQIQYLHGVKILILNIYPLTHSNDDLILNYHQKGDLVFELVDDSRYHALPILDRQYEQIKTFADNSQMMEDYPTAADEQSHYEYLIISSQKFISFDGEDLNSYIDILKEAGIKAKAISIETISSMSSGEDLIQKIRHTIRNEYQNNKIRYVLLAGDADKSGSGDIVPIRKLWSKIRAYNGTYLDIEQHIPSDIYYACLDGVFNADGDDKWGEPGDGGPEGQDVDFLPEVIVGRLPISKKEHLTNFITKQKQVSAYRFPKRTLLLGELIFEELDLWSKDYFEQFIGTCTDHGYVTEGFDSDWTIDSLFDKDEKWKFSSVTKKLSSKEYAHVHHLGHSNTNTNLKKSSYWSIPNLKNIAPFFYYTQGCFAGNFTANDCIVEKWLNSKNAFFAAIANTSYGLGPEDPDPSTTSTPGASHMLHRVFVHNLINNPQSSLATAHQDSKMAHIGYIDHQEIRWVNWASNFLGDPATRINY